MSTLNNKVSLSASGLSRQSEKSYKALTKKSNADLSKTLQQLDVEQKASIARIIHEEYALKNVHHALKKAGLFTKPKLEDPIVLDSEEDEVAKESGITLETDLLDLNAITEELSLNENAKIAESHTEKIKFQVNEPFTCHLPIIIEETQRRPKRQKNIPSSSRGPSYTLPPLTRLDPSLARVRRSFDERSTGSSQSSGRLRHTGENTNYAVDSYSRHGVNTKRKSYMDPIRQPRRNSIDSSRLRPDGRGTDEANPNKPPQAWAVGFAHCRYLRRSVSSPDVLAGRPPPKD
ncbi:uncharacterized protein LOC116612987 [Nematostella vectensis]|uniref:uncharacterized protein LOC116612987 n=1 Tax=Nematostella vectensis TaxID=45351 RepID=UPI0013900F94|nr:uncharacterized protein LOC116612987 [Nematostella vectensis]